MDYDDPGSVNAAIEKNWWLESDTCKYMLACLVHKHNKDISTEPTTKPPGSTRKEIRAVQHQKVSDERAAAKVASGQPYRMHGEDLLNSARVAGMHSQIQTNTINAISTQITILRQNENVYVDIYGQEKFNEMIVNLIKKLPGLQDASLSSVMGTPASSADGDE